MAKLGSAGVTDIVASGLEVLGDGHEEEATAVLLLALRDLVMEHGMTQVLGALRDGVECGADCLANIEMRPDEAARVFEVSSALSAALEAAKVA